MDSERVDEDLLFAYLLGNLSEDEQVRLENRAFSDLDYLRALEAVEADLIDLYVRGELPESDRRSFELRFLRSTERRKKVEFAMALACVTAEQRVMKAAPPERRKAWMSLADMVRGWKLSYQFAAVLASLVCLAGASWLIARHVAMRSQIAILEAQRQDLTVREQELRRQLGNEERRASRPAPAGAVAPVALLVLWPNLSRTQTAGEELTLRPSTQLVRIEVQLEPRDVYPAYRAELRTRGGDEVLIRSNLARRRAGAADVVTFEIPASALGGGEYELALKGVAPGRPLEEVGYYYFKIRTG